MRLVALLLLLCVLTPARAAVYSYVDKDGNRVYTDQPPKGVKATKVPVNTTNNLNQQGQPTRKLSPTPTTPVAKTPKAAPFRYQMLRILVPEPDATVIDQQGQLIVSLVSEPELQPGHSYRLLLDDKEAGVGRSPVFPLDGLDRGTHQLVAEILAADGNVLERTPAQPFHLRRPSLEQKRRAHPCAAADWGKRPECPLDMKPPEAKKSWLPFL
ncbi:penicillin-binding protein [Pseudomonas oryzihabitans]|nr:penicillin-binding protein [Pseudomonas psychrotolerans]